MEAKPFCDCPVCGEIIFAMESVWYYRGDVKCLSHYEQDEPGHIEPAGLELPGVTESID